MAFPLPSVTPPTLSNWEFQYNGLTFGAGTAYGLISVKGLGDLATVRAQDTPFPRDDGEFTGLDVLGGRDIELDMWVNSSTLSPFAASTALGAAFYRQANTNLPLWFQVPGAPVLCSMCRPRLKPEVWDADYAAGARLATNMTLHANDPRIYGAGVQSSVTVGPPAGGLSFPVGPFPVGPFSSTTPEQVTINQTGNIEMRPIVVINGPITNPIISNTSLTGSPYLQFTNPYQTTYTVLAGDQLLIDLGTPHRMLYYSGGIASGSAPSNVAFWLELGSTWWDLIPGNNVISLGSADSGTTGGGAYIWWAPAYAL
jgi:hypothetical protein